ncbi:hypothetical protein DIPPA_17264 [Diplonema papillatum]|nr:hypothetical protein DIPPA_17264 [Diplonema papillatum]
MAKDLSARAHSSYAPGGGGGIGQSSLLRKSMPSVYVEGSIDAVRPGSPQALLRRAFERAFHRPAPSGLKVSESWEDLSQRRSPHPTSAATNGRLGGSHIHPPPSFSPLSPAPRVHAHAAPSNFRVSPPSLSAHGGYRSSPDPARERSVSCGSSIRFIAPTSSGALVVDSASIILSDEHGRRTVIPAVEIAELIVQSPTVNILPYPDPATGLQARGTAVTVNKNLVDPFMNAVHAITKSHGAPCSIRIIEHHPRPRSHSRPYSDTRRPSHGASDDVPCPWDVEQHDHLWGSAGNGGNSVSSQHHRRTSYPHGAYQEHDQRPANDWAVSFLEELSRDPEKALSLALSRVQPARDQAPHHPAYAAHHHHHDAANTNGIVTPPLSPPHTRTPTFNQHSHASLHSPLTLPMDASPYRGGDGYRFEPAGCPPGAKTDDIAAFENELSQLQASLRHRTAARDRHSLQKAEKLGRQTIVDEEESRTAHLHGLKAQLVHIERLIRVCGSSTPLSRSLSRERGSDSVRRDYQALDGHGKQANEHGQEAMLTKLREEHRRLLQEHEKDVRDESKRKVEQLHRRLDELSVASSKGGERDADWGSGTQRSKAATLEENIQSLRNEQAQSLARQKEAQQARAAEEAAQGEILKLEEQIRRLSDGSHHRVLSSLPSDRHFVSTVATVPAPPPQNDAAALARPTSAPRVVDEEEQQLLQAILARQNSRVNFNGQLQQQGSQAGTSSSTPKPSASHRSHPTTPGQASLAPLEHTVSDNNPRSVDASHPSGVQNQPPLPAPHPSPHSTPRMHASNPPSLPVSHKSAASAAARGAAAADQGRELKPAMSSDDPVFFRVESPALMSPAESVHGPVRQPSLRLDPGTLFSGATTPQTGCIPAIRTLSPAVLSVLNSGPQSPEEAVAAGGDTSDESIAGDPAGLLGPPEHDQAPDSRASGSPPNALTPPVGPAVPGSELLPPASNGLRRPSSKSVASSKRPARREWDPTVPLPLPDAPRELYSVEWINPSTSGKVALRVAPKNAGLLFVLNPLDSRGPIRQVVYDGIERFWFPDLPLSSSVKLPKDPSQLTVLSHVRQMCINTGVEHNIPPSLEMNAVTVTLVRKSPEVGFGFETGPNDLVLDMRAVEGSPAAQVGMWRLCRWVITHVDGASVATKAEAQMRLVDSPSLQVSIRCLEKSRVPGRKRPNRYQDVAAKRLPSRTQRSTSSQRIYIAK